MVEAGYEFYFTKGSSFVLTPDKVKLVMVEKGGALLTENQTSSRTRGRRCAGAGGQPSGFKVDNTGDDAFLNY